MNSERSRKPHSSAELNEGLSASPWLDKVVWLTGASSGLGESFAKTAASTGCKLVLTARRADKLQSIADEARRSGGKVWCFDADVTNASAVRAAHERIQQETGEDDVLIANAGTHVPTDVASFSVSEYRSVMELNYFGTLNCIEAVLPEMISRHSGHIAGVGSVAGYRGLPRAAAYGASKSALIHFLESIRFDLEQYGITVSVVNPGFIRTPLTDQNDFPMPFLMEPDDAAQAMLKGLLNGSKEVHFPQRFTWQMKLFRILPFPLYHRLVRKIVYKK